MSALTLYWNGYLKSGGPHFSENIMSLENIGLRYGPVGNVSNRLF